MQVREKSSKTVPITPLTAAVEPRAVLDPTADFSNADCAVVFYKTGDPREGGEITFRVEGEVMRRLCTRANHDLADYVWQNILKRALLTHVY